MANVAPVPKTTSVASVVPKKFPVAPFHAVKPLLPVSPQAFTSEGVSVLNVGTAGTPDDGPAKNGVGCLRGKGSGENS